MDLVVTNGMAIGTTDGALRDLSLRLPNALGERQVDLLGPFNMIEVKCGVMGTEPAVGAPVLHFVDGHELLDCSTASVRLKIDPFAIRRISKARYSPRLRFGGIVGPLLTASALALTGAIESRIPLRKKRIPAVFTGSLDRLEVHPRRHAMSFQSCKDNTTTQPCKPDIFEKTYDPVES